MQNGKESYGLRCDPQPFIDGDGSLQGALIRTFVFEKPRARDRALLSKEIEKTFAEQMSKAELDQRMKGSAVGVNTPGQANPKLQESQCASASMKSHIP